MARELNAEKKRKNEKIAMTVLLIVILFLYVIFMKEILIPFIRLELRHDVDGALELLREKGWMGFLAVILVEALQMVVVFVPAEFIQISSGLSYPFWLALILCDLGVCLGATIIYYLVNNLRFQSTAYQRRKQNIEHFSSVMHERNAVIFMYLLFFMPIIPFGAICYYGSGRKLKFGTYLRTVATGVIPSIIVSNLMGRAGSAFLVKDLPFWLLILIIVVLAAALFALIWFFIEKYLLKEYDGTPDSLMYAVSFVIVKLVHGRRPKAVIDDARLQEADLPYVMLVNHESFFDFYYVHQMMHPRNPTLLANEYYCTRPVLKTILRKIGIIPKKLFVTELTYPMKIMRSLKAGFPVVIFPEGRLSPDGRSNPIVEEGGAYFKKLRADLVLVKINGAYFTGPKWRSRRYRNDVHVTVEDVIKKEELAAISAEDLNVRIRETLYNDASEHVFTTYPQKDKAKGLENILYRCPDCGALYTTRGTGNELVCTACKSRHALDESYHFTDAPFTIAGRYDQIRDAEKQELSAVSLQAEVRTVIHGENGGPKRKEQGTCSLTHDTFSYRSGSVSFDIPTAELPALAFSCGKEFELYYRNELYYFYPKEDPQQVARWALVVDLLYEERQQHV